jgi:AcrR family transcriptional regulator
MYTDRFPLSRILYTFQFTYCQNLLISWLVDKKKRKMTSKTEQKMRQSPKRKQIIEAAFKLFKENGFYATGVDLIMRTAKVSKRTLYKYFPSKNNLIVAVLEHYRSTYKEHMHGLLNHQDMSSREKILAIFDDAMSWFTDTNFHGCLAVNAMAEFSGKDQAIENSCLCFKHWEIDVLSNLSKDLDNSNADELAHKLFVLLEGMSAIAQVTKAACPIDMVKMADEIIDAHLS